MLTRTVTRRRFHSEAGQTLILALAFIAFFGVTIVAVLRVADLPGQQHAITETTANNDSSDEGGAAYAAADATRTDVQLSCAAGDSGQLTMQNSSHQANYSVTTCNPSGSSGTGGGGPSCLLCILNESPTPVAPATSVFFANRGMTTTGGNDFINGTIVSGTKLTASPAGAHIFALNGATTSGCTCSPSPVLTYSPAIVDPLATLGAPSPVAGKPSGCPSWNPATGCTATFSGGSNTVHPGLWASLSTSGGSTNITFAAGTYVFSGPLTLSGGGTIDGSSGVTLYLACANYGSAGTACPSSGAGRTGGYIDISGGGSTTLTAPSSGQYPNIVVLSDPNLLDYGGTSSCENGSLTACLVTISGNGSSVIGSQDLRSGGATFQGNGGETVSSGRFVANSLYISVSNHAGAGLSLTGPGVIGTATCGLFDDAVSSTGGPGTGRAIIQSQCGTAKGVVDFNYTP